MREQIVYLSEQLWASQHELVGLKDAPSSDTDRLRCSSELHPPAAEPKAASALNGVLRWLPSVRPPLRRSSSYSTHLLYPAVTHQCEAMHNCCDSACDSYARPLRTDWTAHCSSAIDR